MFAIGSLFSREYGSLGEYEALFSDWIAMSWVDCHPHTGTNPMCSLPNEVPNCEKLSVEVFVVGRFLTSFRGVCPSITRMRVRCELESSNGSTTGASDGWKWVKYHTKIYIKVSVKYNRHIYENSHSFNEQLELSTSIEWIYHISGPKQIIDILMHKVVSR